MDTNELAHQIIARVSAWRGAHSLDVERIGGLTNANYLVRVDGASFVLRVSGENAARLGIDRQHELAALQSAAAAGIAPEVAAFLQPEGHLVTRWVEGHHWDVSEFRTPENVRLLTETVKRVHALPANGAEFSPFLRVNAFLETARKFQTPLPANLDTCLETMQRVEEDQRNDSSHWRRFCHNDLVSVNYLVNGQSVTVLDWEFAGMGDLYYDLATIVYTHDSHGAIPPALEDVMLECYFGAVNAFQRKRLLGMKYMLMLFTGAWAFAQQGMVLGGLIQPVEGFDYLEFSQYLFEHDIRVLQAQFDHV